MPIIRFGLTEVASSKLASVDVVFVHGLNGDPQKTWTAETSKTFWPSQLLPPILDEEHARILVYGYDADVTSFTDGVSKDKIHNHAEHLVAELAANRRIRRASDRPIIFIAHSLGGLVVKRALIYSSEIRGTKTEHLRGIFVSTYGILFLGTPHKGSDLAKWGSRLERICSAVMPKKVVDTNNSLVDALKENNETLQNIDRQFIQIMSKFHIFFFHEAEPTDMKGTMEYVRFSNRNFGQVEADRSRRSLMKSQLRLQSKMSSAQAFRQTIHTCASSKMRVRRASISSPKLSNDMQKRRLLKSRDAGLQRRRKGLFRKRQQPRNCYLVNAVFNLRRYEPLIGIGSVKQNTPQSDTTSTFEPSPGKNVKALPAPEHQKGFLESEYTVEFEDDSVRVAR